MYYTGMGNFEGLTLNSVLTKAGELGDAGGVAGLGHHQVIASRNERRLSGSSSPARKRISRILLISAARRARAITVLARLAGFIATPETKKAAPDGSGWQWARQIAGMKKPAQGGSLAASEFGL
jgi:hypothetical protein